MFRTSATLALAYLADAIVLKEEVFAQLESE
jgi:hypothetical protein